MKVKMAKDQIIKSGLRNIVIVVFAQAMSLVLGVVKILCLPLILGVTNNGYWQIYLLYLSYAGIFALGFNDGIYLRYGKYNYEDLPKQLFRSSIKTFLVLQLVITIIVSLFVLLEADVEKKKAMMWASINIPIVGLSGILLYTLQATNQLKKYSFYNTLDKIIVLLLISIIYFFRIDQYTFIIIADTFSKIIVLLFMSYSCKEILFGKGSRLTLAYTELVENISVGIKLLLANLTGMLVLGFGRFIVERFESVEAYSSYSLALSTINLLVIFISAIGLVIYPTLNRLDKTLYSKYFVDLNKLIIILAFGMLIFYFPLYIFINKVMKEYVIIFEYLPIVFAIVFIQFKMQILINPYYKLLREEKAMLKANIVGLLFAVFIITPLYYMSKSVLMVAVGTLLAMTIRLYLSELYISKILNTHKSNILVELLGIVIFILFSYQSNILFGFLGYLTVFLVFFISHIKIIKKYLTKFHRA